LRDTARISTWHSNNHPKEFTMTIVDTEIPGYVTGTWAIDPAHSYVGFVIRHAMIAKVRGQFESVQGEIVTAPDVLESRVEVTIDAASFHTNNEMRNQHIRSADFLDADNYPSLTFTSTGIRPVDGYLIDGDLTIRGVTKPVVLQATPPRFGPNAEGAMSVGVSAHTVIRRSEYGIDANMPMDGGFLLSDDVEVILEIEGNLGA
jgi:polyisoprenoid-binding protein YceI